MTENKTEKATATKTRAIKGETLFDREEILSNPQAFDVSSYVLAGAMAEMTDEKYSRSQVKAAIEKFTKRKVEQK